MGTLISNQWECSVRPKLFVRVHLPACLPAVVPLFNLTIEEVNGRRLIASRCDKDRG